MLDVVREINLFAQPIKAKKEKCALAAYFSLAPNFQSIPQWPRVITSFKLGRKNRPDTFSRETQKAKRRLSVLRIDMHAAQMGRQAQLTWDYQIQQTSRATRSHGLDQPAD